MNSTYQTILILFGLLYIVLVWECFYFTNLLDRSQHDITRMIKSEHTYWSNDNNNDQPQSQSYELESRRHIGWKATAPTESKRLQTKILIVFPYRDREIHYHKFMKHFASIKRPNWDVSFYVIEQGNNLDFRRAWLLNVGIAEALKTYDKQKHRTCVVTHDIDMHASPQVDYSWCDRPTQTCSELSCDNDSVPYHTYAGGTVEALLSDWETINGFTNVARGWGGEDDELYQRFRLNNLVAEDGAVRRAPKGKGACECLNDNNHTPRKRNLYKLNEVAAKVYRMQEGSDEWKRDGLNTLQYNVVDRWVDDYNTIWLRVDEVEGEEEVEVEKSNPDEKLKMYKILQGKSIYAGILKEGQHIF